jgi:hypothetical protein
MMQAALKASPVLVDVHPQTPEAARANLLAFADESRTLQNATRAGTDGLVLFTETEMPRMRQCYGWMRFTGQELLDRLPSQLCPPSRFKVGKVERSIDENASYTAIIYEFVESSENDPVVVQKVLDFLWCVGFSHVPVTKAENWTSGILLDYSDITHHDGYGWEKGRFGYIAAERILC